MGSGRSSLTSRGLHHRVQDSAAKSGVRSISSPSVSRGDESD